MAFTYRVETLCAATIREVWTIRSRDPLSREAITHALECRDTAPRGDVTAHEDETRVTEADRTVVDVSRLVG